MVSLSRLTSIISGSIVLTGCVSAATSISATHKLVAAEPIQIEFIVPATPMSGVQPILLSPATAKGYEKEYLGYVLLDSGTKCQDFADRLSAVQRGVDTNFDILTVILSALATAFTPLSTVHGLTAAATISTGTKAAIDADVYAKATASLILQEINQTYYAEIDKYRTALANRQDSSNIVPVLEVSKIEAIHRECSLDSAIANLSQSQAAANAALAAISGAFAGASAARQQGLSPEAGAIAGAGAGAAAGGAAGMTAAPEAAATQGAAAGATAVRPPAPGGAPGAGIAPSASAPLAPPIPFIPSTSARSDLFRALLSDAQGVRPFDPTRVKLMRECWNELLTPPPENFATWLQQATDQSFAAVAACINAKATIRTPGRSGASIHVVPTSPARSQVFLALLSDSEGRRPFDPGRIKLMRQCWNELLSPPPENFATWLQQATDQTLQVVANCINSKAAKGMD